MRCLTTGFTGLLTDNFDFERTVDMGTHIQSYILRTWSHVVALLTLILLANVPFEDTVAPDQPVSFEV